MNPYRAGIEVAVEDRRIEWLLAMLFFVALAWAVLPDGLSWIRAESDVDAQSGSLLRKLQWLPLFATAAWMIWRRRDVSLGMLHFVNPGLLAFVAWVALSVTWSDYHGATLRRVVILAGVAAIGLALQLSGTPAYRIRQRLRIGVTILLVASFLAVLLFPHVARDAELGNAWVGVTRSKNHLGVLAGFGVLLWLHGHAAREIPLWRAAFWMLFSLALLVLSHSATSLVCTALMMPLVWLLLRPPLRVPRFWTWLTLCAVAVFGFLAFLHLMFLGLPSWDEIAQPVAGAVGRDITLTGRLEIWRLVGAEVARHPWLGTGYGAFWLGAGGPAPWVTQDLYGILWEAHNGYLDVLNETGVIGLLLACGFLLLHGRGIARLMRFDRSDAVCHAFVLGFLLINNVAESSLFRPMNLLFFLSIVMSFGLSASLARIALAENRRAMRSREIIAGRRPAAAAQRAHYPGQLS